MLKHLKDIHIGETCVIVGGGPSLRATPLKLLEKYPTFGCNKIFALYYKLKGTPEKLHGFVPTYYTCVDDKMIMDCIHHLFDYPAKKIFLRRGLPFKGVNYLRVEVKAGISDDINREVVLGGTVTNVQLQIAYYMGFTTALLVGIDHDYHMYGEKKPGALLLAEGEDDSHFYPDYFTNGHLYAAAELDNINKVTFPLVNHMWGSTGRRIINLTPGTKETVFKKGKYKDWMK